MVYVPDPEAREIADAAADYLDQRDALVQRIARLQRHLQAAAGDPHGASPTAQQLTRASLARALSVLQQELARLDGPAPGSRS
jgi:C4-dicarboxylate-specific signal transduction histidine kinase